MGQIIDQNEDPNSVDTWALVTGLTVSNIISSNFSFIETIQDDYDYLVDISVGGQTPVNAGDIYIPASDSFRQNYANVLRNDVNQIQSAYLQALNDYNTAISGDFQSEADTGVTNGITDSSSSYTTNEQVKFENFIALIQNGG